MPDDAMYSISHGRSEVFYDRFDAGPTGVVT